MLERNGTWYTFELEFSKNLFPLFRKREYRVRFSVGKSVSIFIKVKERWYLSKKKKRKEKEQEEKKRGMYGCMEGKHDRNKIKYIPSVMVQILLEIHVPTWNSGWRESCGEKRGRERYFLP